MKKILLPLIIIALCACMGTATMAADKDTATDRRAAQAHALALAQFSGMNRQANPLAAAFAVWRAQHIAPADTTVSLEANHSRLISQIRDSITFNTQLALLKGRPHSPVEYWSPVILLSQFYMQPADSLFPYRVARLAADSHPDKTGVAALALERAGSYLATKHYPEGADNDDIAVPLTQADSIFARSNIAFADSVTARNGYDSRLDMRKAQLLFILDDNDALRRLAQDMYRRDPEDPEVLDAITHIYMSIGDTAQVTETGLKVFELEPQPDQVYRLFSALYGKPDQQRVTNAVLATAINQDLDPQLRTRLMDALATAYYQAEDYLSLDSITPLLTQLDTVSREIIAEEPDNLGTVMSLAVMARATNWIHNYGYRYMMEYATAYPDSTEHLVPIAELTSQYAPMDPRGVNIINSLRQDSLMHPVKVDLMLANYYMNNEALNEAHNILRNITLTDVRELVQFEDAHGIKDNEETGDNTAEEPDTRARNRWVTVKTIQSDIESQQDDYKAAMATLQEIINIQPDNSTALNNLAYFMAENNGDLHQALTLAERSLSIAPDNVNTLDTRAWIYYLLGKYPQAMEDMHALLRQLDIDPREILDPEGSPLLTVIDEHHLNAQALKPLLEHLMAIYHAMSQTDAQDNGTYLRAALKIARALTTIDPGNEAAEKLLETTGNPDE